MDLEEKEAITGTLSAADVECAIVDGCNVDLREVLRPRGIIDREADAAWPDQAGNERNALKYAIAERTALAWLRHAAEQQKK